MVSRARIRGVSGVDLTVSIRAMVVAEFLEKSPINRLDAEFVHALRNSGDLAKEPESVLGVKVIFDRGGSEPRRLSGRTSWTVLSGKWLRRYSEMRYALAKL